MMRADVIVLGAGMVGVATALHLSARGASVVLIDRGPPAGETSLGNAGLIQAEAVVPYAFPRSATVIFGALAGTRGDARVDWRAVPSHARRWWSFFRHGSPSAVRRSTAGLAPLVHAALPEHLALAEQAGVQHLIRPGGYLRIFRDAAALETAAVDAADVEKEHGIPFRALSPNALADEEPFLRGTFAGAIHYPEPQSVSDPADLGAAYAVLFQTGGRFLAGDAKTLDRDGGGWRVDTEKGPVSAAEAVVALGPWSGDLLAAFGVRVPLFVKRGYHTHRQPAGNAVLNHLVVDEENGVVLTSQRRGIRITTGAEFAARDALAGGQQLPRALSVAERLFPFDQTPATPAWRGARPCLPDLLPMIGAVPGLPGLWANFGHQHLGFTLGPATGRLLAEAMMGADPFTSLEPFAVDRFAR